MLNEDKVYIIWTFGEDRVSEILLTTQNALLAEAKVEEYSNATDDPVYVDTIVARIVEHIDQDSQEEYPNNVFTLGSKLEIERGI
jgi:hypothetical protein